MNKQCVKNLFAKSREWKKFMVENLSLAPEFATKSFADVLTARDLSANELYDLLTQAAVKVGVFNYREETVARSIKAYQVATDILCDSRVVPQGDVFWLKHPDYPEVVFEKVPAAMEIFRVYAAEKEVAEIAEPEDSILFLVPYLGRVADISFVKEIPAEVEEKKKKVSLP